MSEQEFVLELEKKGISLSEEQLKSFRIYLDFLLEYNSHTNLTAIKNAKDVYLKHFYDSVIGINYFDVKNKRVLDIGSGAGFPGVPLKIVESSMQLYLLDSNGKKTRFLEELKVKLGIDFVVINERAEKYNIQERESFDLVTGRAVTAMPALSELCIPFVKVGGMFVAYKGVLDETLENGKWAITVLGGEIVDVKTSKLPKENSVRSFVLVKKVCKTESQYPRVFDKILKKPLQKK